MNKTPVTFDSAIFVFYDIESLRNLFTLCAYNNRTKKLEIYYLADTDADFLDMLHDPQTKTVAEEYLKTYIRTHNQAYPGTDDDITLYDLNQEESAVRLAETFGCSDADQPCNPRSRSNFPASFRLVPDTDPDYDANNMHPYFAGYNSFNYDTTMLSIYLDAAFSGTKYNTTSKSNPNPIEFSRYPVKAESLRAHNDKLFTSDHRQQMPRYLISQDFTNEGWNSTAHKIRQNMIQSGRHIDIARLNEKQQRVAQKRLCGTSGYQIMESDKLHGHNAVIKTFQEFVELITYNVSDVIGLSRLAKLDTYSGAFDLKKGLLDEYPETIFEPETIYSKSGARVRRDRLTPDTSSARFAGTILCPSGSLDDIDAVSYMYPHPEVAKEWGIEPFNVLERAKDFFYENIQDTKARQSFDEIYRYYKWFEGKNFNSSEKYLNDHGIHQEEWALEEDQLASVANAPAYRLNMPYFQADGTPTSCFVTFSTGGLHGAELNTALWEYEAAMHDAKQHAIDLARQTWPDPIGLFDAMAEQADTIILPSGMKASRKKVCLNVNSPEKATWRKITPKTDDTTAAQIRAAQVECETPAEFLALSTYVKGTVTLPDGTVAKKTELLAVATKNKAQYRDAPSKARPELFKQASDGTNKMNKAMTFTSAAEVNHEDFSSYYPCLLINLRAFLNALLGEDRYAKIYQDKEHYGQQIKKLDDQAQMLEQMITQAAADQIEANNPVVMEARQMLQQIRSQIGHLTVLRNGTKLILNSASGAGDANHDTPIRMNNQILSMRIIGQIFSWWVGQYQTLGGPVKHRQTDQGARVVSTNTDGLYTVMDPDLNNRLLGDMEKIIGIKIEPERMFLISKDANNRLELSKPDANGHYRKMIASGGNLACFRGPNPEKSLAHPAIMDAALVRYMTMIAEKVNPEKIAMDKPADRDTILSILNDEVATAKANGTETKSMLLFQNVLAASNATNTYQFAFDDTVDGNPVNPRTLLPHNRVFIMKSGTPNTVHMMNVGSYKSPQITHNPIALSLLHDLGMTYRYREHRDDNFTLLPNGTKADIRTINQMSPEWNLLICNHDLEYLNRDDKHFILDNLDINCYADLVVNSFNSNWMNKSGEETEAEDEETDEIMEAVTV